MDRSGVKAPGAFTLGVDARVCEVGANSGRSGPRKAPAAGLEPAVGAAAHVGGASTVNDTAAKARILRISEWMQRLLD